MPSRLFIYYNEREYEGTVYEDSGASIRDGMKVVNMYGACKEELWDYDISKFTVKPPTICYSEGIKDKVVSYSRITQTVQQMKSCLASGFPFVFGFMVYESFMSGGVASTGVANMPRVNDRLLGGHAVLAVGYNDKSKRFIIRNS
jgi:C1A family cysteine protease